MPVMDEIVNEHLEEVQRDFIWLPMLSCAARQWLGARTTEEARKKLSLEMAQRLYEHGLRPGDYDLETELDYWPDEGCRAMAEQEVRAGRVGQKSIVFKLLAETFLSGRLIWTCKNRRNRLPADHNPACPIGCLRKKSKSQPRSACKISR